MTRNSIKDYKETIDYLWKQGHSFMRLFETIVENKKQKKDDIFKSDHQFLQHFLK